MKNISLKTIYLFSLALLAITIPIHFRVSLYALAFAIAMGLIYNITSKIYFKGILSNKFNILLILFWVIHLISLSYSADLSYGLSKIFRMISILILPLFITFDFDSKDKRKITIAYIASATLVLVFFLLRAFYHSLSMENGEYVFNFHNSISSYGSFFYYQEFVNPHHPSYFSMYLTLAMVFVLKFYKEANSVKNKISLIVLSLFLVAGVVLTSSRAGLLTLVIVLSVAMFWLLNQRGKIVGLISALLIIPVALYYLSDNPRFKTITTYVKASVENNTQIKDEYESLVMIRVKMWPIILKDLNIKEILLGVGLGDTNQRFIQAYKNNNLEYAAATELNAHNQYIQTLVSTGILGLLLLLTIIGYGFWFAYNNRDMLLFLFFTIISVNFIFESMLERIFGVIFFTFFLLFLSTKPQNQNKQMK